MTDLDTGRLSSTDGMAAGYVLTGIALNAVLGSCVGTQDVSDQHQYERDETREHADQTMM